MRHVRSLVPDAGGRGAAERTAGGRPSRGVSLAVRRRDGSTAWLEFSTVPLFDPRGRVTRTLALCTDVTARRDAETRMAHRALHDGLTDLPNPTLFRDRLESAVARCRRSGGQVAVVFLDLDGFKRVNDEQGHAEGDRVLVAVAGRLAAAVREATPWRAWAGTSSRSAASTWPTHTRRPRSRND